VLQGNAPNVPPLVPQSPINGFAGDANASAAVECGVIVGVMALIVALGALVLDQDGSTLLHDSGIVLGRIIPLPRYSGWSGRACGRVKPVPSLMRRCGPAGIIDTSATRASKKGCPHAQAHQAVQARRARPSDGRSWPRRRSDRPGRRARRTGAGSG